MRQALRVLRVAKRNKLVSRVLLELLGLSGTHSHSILSRHIVPIGWYLGLLVILPLDGVGANRRSRHCGKSLDSSCFNVSFGVEQA